MSEKVKKKSHDAKKSLSNGWIVVPSKTYPDRVYFFNTITKCSTWNNPCETSRERSSNNHCPETSKKSQHEPQMSTSKKRKRSRKRSRKKHQTLDKTTKENDEIQDYDEEEDQYFVNLADNYNKNNISSPSSPGSDISFPVNTNSDLCLVSQNDKGNGNKISSHYVTSTFQNSSVERSLCDLITPSTSHNTPVTEKSSRKENKSKESRSVSLSYSCSKETCSKERDSSSKRKKRDKRAQSVSETHKKVENKTIKNVAFKKRDKTPAQTRLLKLRQQNAEYLKKMAEEDPSFPTPKTPNLSLTKIPSNTSQLPQTPSNDSFTDSFVNAKKVCNNEQNLAIRDDFEEEMDWEPSNEEMDVQSINEFRLNKEQVKNKPSYILFGLSSDTSLSLPSKSKSWLLVLDTNIFVSCLSFVKELRDTYVSDLGYPLLYIPWRVLQELDHLKDSRFDRQLQANVRKAISYLNESFKIGHPRCFGQSLEDFTKMVDSEATAPDDEILQTCIQLQKSHPEKKVTLLTNDKNLESKAIISNVEAFSKEGFYKKYFSSTLRKSTEDNDLLDVNVNQIDNIVCAVKHLLKGIFPMVVETEMKSAFHDDWIKVAYKKPPWTLQDSMDCFLKHYRSVFFVLFPKSILQDVENLYDKLFYKEPETSKDVKEILEIFQRLLDSFKMSKEQERPYMKLIDSTLLKISRLLEELSSKKTLETDDSNAFSKQEASIPQESAFSSSNESNIFIQQMTNEAENRVDAEMVLILFKDIWDSLRNFCCMITDLVNSSFSNNQVSIPEIKLKISRIIMEIGEFTTISEKILEVHPNDITMNHPLIVQFSNLLVQIQPQMTFNLKNRLPICLSAFFVDSQARALLSSSLTDFKEFTEELIKSNEALKTVYPSL